MCHGVKWILEVVQNYITEVVLQGRNRIKEERKILKIVDYTLALIRICFCFFLDWGLFKGRVYEIFNFIWCRQTFGETNLSDPYYGVSWKPKVKK